MHVPPPFFWSEWYAPLTVMAIATPHSTLHSSSSIALYTPPGVRGGSAVPVPTGHTHTVRWLEDKAPGTANEAKPWLRAQPLLFSLRCKGKA